MDIEFPENLGGIEEVGVVDNPRFGQFHTSSQRAGRSTPKAKKKKN